MGKAFNIASFMKPEKHITLLAVGILVLALFFLLPRNGLWMSARVLPYWSDLQHQRNDLSEESRKVQRYGHAYTLSEQIAGFFPDRQNVLVLLPSTAYFKNYGIDYPVPEPVIFYYYTGLKTTWAGNRLATKAGWIAGVDKGKIVVHAVTSSQQLLDSIASFKKFPYTL
jgi:hypothetical protein